MLTNRRACARFAYSFLLRWSLLALGLTGASCSSLWQPWLEQICPTEHLCWQRAVPEGRTLYGLWASDPDQVWAVGANGSIARREGDTWRSYDSGTTATLTSIWGSDANNIWVAGNDGNILHFDGSAFSISQRGAPIDYNAVFGISANNVFVVGTDGHITHWDGKTWSEQVSNTVVHLSGIWGRSASEIWAVGNAGVILKYDGVNWAPENIGDSENLYAVWGNDSEVWAVGNKGKTQRQQRGGAWVDQPSGTQEILFDVFTQAADSAWAFGTRGTILKWIG